MIKDIRNLSVGKKIVLILCALATFIFDFFYTNWISYRMALSHMESEYFIPLEISILSAIALGVIKIIETKTHKVLFMKYIVAIIFVGSVVAFVFCGYCPACNEVHNPIYKLLYKIFTGSEYAHI
ncbi:MAG: hypothetical protein IJD96_01995 [Lachnospiraceae bacterium]|nr:hypothetical protein [Lachnospiraceae bacterium]